MSHQQSSGEMFVDQGDDNIKLVLVTSEATTATKGKGRAGVMSCKGKEKATDVLAPAMEKGKGKGKSKAKSKPKQIVKRGAEPEPASAHQPAADPCQPRSSTSQLVCSPQAGDKCRPSIATTISPSPKSRKCGCKGSLAIEPATKAKGPRNKLITKNLITDALGQDADVDMSDIPNSETEHQPQPTPFTLALVTPAVDCRHNNPAVTSHDIEMVDDSMLQSLQAEGRQNDPKEDETLALAALHVSDPPAMPAHFNTSSPLTSLPSLSEGVTYSMLHHTNV
ncbi:hypothetical protein BS17DRAFT_829667 [Gyrodon lividus]|nr:hypothetical protein BS17DRAFT_829667 [Gyrodon lividus]